MDTNNCDKCGVEEPSEDLVWITADDFTPTKTDKKYWTEKKHIRMTKKYDALCVRCYCEEIRK